MRRHLPSGRQHGLPLLLANDWTPQQALAVVELLDDLRAVLYDCYLIQIQRALKAERNTQDRPGRQRDLPF